MKKWTKVIALLLTGVLLTGCANKQTQEGSSFQTRQGSKVPPAFQKTDEVPLEDVKAKNFVYDKENMDYRLVWSDEFDYEGVPDAEKWSFEVGGNGWGNQELQYYTNGENASVADGLLTIELRKEETNGNDYSSARMVTNGKADWKYGKIEVCAKLPSGLGTWPAIWMMPTASAYGTWPNSGEIDIMEHVGYGQGTIYSNIHTEAYNHTKNTGKGDSIRLEDVSDAFHVYSVEWLPDKLLFSVDGEEFFSYDPNEFVANPTSAEWPYDQNMFLILNIAFGGSWGGSKGIDEELTSAKMEVDYVRVYQSPQVSEMIREDRVANNPLLKADGKVLRDEAGTGEVVQLKGTNIGGGLFQELWMTSTKATGKVKDELSIQALLTERFGSEEARRLTKTYNENYFTEADFDYCKEVEMNCLRLPFWYRNIVDENGEFYEDWAEYFDWFVEQAASRNMYVILDFHGAPGSQNGSDHSGKDGGDAKEAASEFFFGDNVKANQELYYKIWEEVAKHYKDNPWVAGYDLLNEPYCTYRYNSSKSAEKLHQMLWEVYDIAYDKIRAIDHDHVIIMEATWDPVDLPNPTVYGWENVMYEYHNYLYDDYDNKAGKQITNMETKLNAIAAANYNVPSYLGEFAYFNNLDAWDEGIKLVNDTGISWTTWTYKVTSNNGNWGIRNQKNLDINLETCSLEDIQVAWEQVGESNENAGLREVLEKYYKQVYMIYNK